MNKSGRERLAIATFATGYGIEFQHLHFYAIRQTILLARLRVTPDENPGIPARFDVLPFDMQYEVLILLVGTHHADRGRCRALSHPSTRLPSKGPAGCTESRLT